MKTQERMTSTRKNGHPRQLSKFQAFLSSRKFHFTVLGIILFNSIIIGIETSPVMDSTIGPQLSLLIYTILGLFVIEMIVRIMVFREEFFKHGWNIFDLVIIVISLFPHAAGLSILRLFRVIKSLSMFEISPYMNHLILALRHVGLSILNVSFLMIISFYILGVIGVELFAEHFPKQFGSLPWSFFTLFRLMVYDDYGTITRPILEVYPYAWIYFLVITVILAFVLINFFVAIVVTALQRAVDTERDPILGKVKQEMKILEKDENTIQTLRAEIQELKEMIGKLKRESS